jgi:hypothetical protein
MNKFKLLFAAACLCLAWFNPAVAEEKSEGVGVLIKITAKDGHDKALIQGITDYHKWVANFDGHMRFNWWKAVTGPDTGVYYASSGNHDWADFDAEYDWEEKSNEVLEANVMPHIADMHRMMVVDMDDISHYPEDWSGYNFVQVESWYVRNGHYGTFNEGLKRVTAALKAGGFPGYWGFSRVASGGYGNQIDLIVPVKGWAGMAAKKPSFYDIMVEELGGDEAFQTFMTDWGETFKVGHSEMLEWMPGASDYGDE